MKKIITLTFSPCIDKSVSVESLVSEKKMKCFNQEINPGGGGINVARVITRLGGEVFAIFPLSKRTSLYFKNVLKEEKVKIKIIKAKNDTRENIEVFDEDAKKQYRFGMPSSELLKEEWQECLTSISSCEKVDYIVVSGSLPEHFPESIFSKIATLARDKKAKLVVDTSGQALIISSKESIYFLKTNAEEFSFLLGLKKIEITEIEQVARDFIDKNSCEVIVVSLGSEGAMLITKNEFYFIKPPIIEVKNTTGAGDSMLAGILYSLSLGNDLRKSLEWGVACGTATTLNYGTALCSKIDVMKVLKKIEDINNNETSERKNII